MAFRVRRQSRYKYLLKAGFTRYEAYELSRFRDRSMVYFKAMVADRRWMLKGLLREAKYNNWSRTRFTEEWGQLIKYNYRTKHWIVGGRLDVWAMLRDYRDRLIYLGAYCPKPKRKRHAFDQITNIRLDKGNVSEQRRRYREKLESRGY